MTTRKYRIDTRLNWDTKVELWLVIPTGEGNILISRWDQVLISCFYLFCILIWN